MLNFAEEVTGKRELPGFSRNVIYDEEVTCYLCPLHEMVMNGFVEVGLSKSTLLRAFAKSKGAAPYRCLENIRIGAARKLLEQGIAPIDAALQTGFSDQSYFTNYFNSFVGLAPGIYRDMFLEKQGSRGTSDGV